MNTIGYNIEEKLQDVFEKLGIFIDTESYDTPLNLSSLQFVQVIISLEETFFIRFAEDFTDFDKMITFNNFFSYVNNYFS